MGDRVTLARACEDAGMQHDAAEKFAGAVWDAIRDNVATDAGLQHVRTDLKLDIQAIRTDLRREIKAVRSEIDRAINKQTVFGSVLLIGLWGAILTFLHYRPPLP